MSAAKRVSSSSSTIVVAGKSQEVPTASGSATDDAFIVSHQNANPLMNQLVLMTLFQHVKPHDLRTCRLVCKTWNAAALPSVRVKCEVTIQELDYSKPGNQRRHAGRTENRNIAAFVKLMRSSTTGIPFSKFNWEAYKGSAHVKKMFLRICGDTIKEMNLSRCNILLSHLSEILSHVPNLECFKTPCVVRIIPGHVPIQLFSDDMNPRPRLTRLKTLGIRNGLYVEKEVFQILFKNLFETAENISSIVFTNYYMNFEPFDVVLEVLNVIESTGREPCIQSLSILKLTEASAETLKRMITKNNGLKLKKLTIQNDLDTGNMWFELASLCKDDLVELSSDRKCCRRALHNPAVCELPVMNKLKMLDVTLTTTGSNSFLSCNLNTTFPVLEKLSIWNRFRTITTANVEELFTGDEPCPSIKSLQLKMIPLEIDTLGRIIFMFPALTKIQLRLKLGRRPKRALRLLWTEMTQLEELDLQIEEAFNIDPLFTGIPLQECRNIKVSYSYLLGLKSMSEEEWTREILELGDIDRKPSIANLTNLRRLRLSFPPDGGRMSNVTGCFGLFPLKSLKHISIDMCQLSKTCCKVLVTQMKLESWEFLTCSRWTVPAGSFGGHIRYVDMRPVDENIIPPKSYPYEN